MDQYTAPRDMGPGSAQGAAREAVETPDPPDLITILKAIQDSREAVESKVDGVRVDLSLVRQDLRRPTCEACGSLLASLPASFTLVGGDFNTVPDFLGDVSAAPSSARPLRSACLKAWAKSWGLCDAWRVCTHTSVLIPVGMLPITPRPALTLYGFRQQM
ncbi:hypothetical protein NDU88_000372 [Pleurodeles waltl]|uniref:Endonuclease/exonuclease/phosphatase domain-containing protein n=1 Tax=Pleurodeles waltl TaxID=8319 RepID=A0AAV7Q3U6_PLEWA|nr:hypothetical protein NDU88_000372 [Pleurodeles waltl]